MQEVKMEADVDPWWTRGKTMKPFFQLNAAKKYNKIERKEDKSNIFFLSWQ